MTQAARPGAIPVALGSDHAGVALKATLREALEAAGHPALDMGTNGPESVDYPDFADAVAAAVRDGRARLGVLVCGTGIGISIAANRHPGIRCALVHDVTGARLAREHNDANVLALGARVIGPEVALDALRAFLSTPFGGGRHERRIRKLTPDWSPRP
jgi:ribose 5-phosphate isomerase B